MHAKPVSPVSFGFCAPSRLDPTPRKLIHDEFHPIGVVLNKTVLFTN